MDLWVWNDGSKTDAGFPIGADNHFFPIDRGGDELGETGFGFVHVDSDHGWLG